MDGGPLPHPDESEPATVGVGGRTTAVVEVKLDRIRDGEAKLAANLIVTQFVLPPREGRGTGGETG